MKSQILIGLAAGLTAALLYASAAAISPLAVVLFYLGPLPVFLAALGWGHATGIIAGISAGVAIGVLHSPVGAGLFLISVVVPALVLARVTMISRVTAAGDDEWYPVGRILLWTGLISGATTISTSLFMGISKEEIAAAIGRLLENVVVANPSLGQNQNALDQIAALMADIIAPVSAVLWALALLVNLWLAARILRSSGRLARPWPELKLIAAPPKMQFALGFCLVLTFIGGPVAFVAGIAATCLGMVYALVGLSVVHFILPNVPLRTIALSAMYFVLIFLTVPLSFLPVTAIVVVGLAESFLGLRARAAIRRGEPPPPIAV